MSDAVTANDIWRQYFDRDISSFELCLVTRFAETIGVHDPIFPIAVLLCRLVHESIGETEKAVLEHGPALARRLNETGSGIAVLSGQIRVLEQQLKALEESSQRVMRSHEQLGKLLQRDLDSISSVILFKDRPLGFKAASKLIAITLVVVFATFSFTIWATSGVDVPREEPTASWNPAPAPPPPQGDDHPSKGELM